MFIYLFFKTIKSVSSFLGSLQPPNHRHLPASLSLVFCSRSQSAHRSERRSNRRPIKSHEWKPRMFLKFQVPGQQYKGGRGNWMSEFEISLVYTLSSRTGWAMWRDTYSCLNKNSINKTPNKQTKTLQK